MKYPSTQVARSPLTVWLLLAVLALTWGSSFILIKKALVVFSVPQVGTLRVFAAFLFFIPILILKRRQLPPPGRWGWCLVAGLLGNLVPALLFAAAGSRLNSSVSGILNSFTPLFALLIGVLFFRQPLRSRQIWGMLFGLAGCVLIILVGTEGKFSLNNSAFLVILATVLYGFNLHIVKQFLSGIPPLALTATIFATTGPLAAIGLFSGDFLQRAVQPEAFTPLILLLTLGVVGTGIAMILFNWLLQITSAVVASSVTYLMPIVAVVWGLLDGEKLYAQHLLGMAVILVGVYLVNRPTRQIVSDKPVEMASDSNR
ncbi:MAG: DMT family transporter [Cytophagaceae bacterium]|nr:DMT family transporter [Cytophagaceae bacterium]